MISIRVSISLPHSYLSNLLKSFLSLFFLLQKVLMANRMKFNPKDNDGWMPGMYAAVNIHWKIVEVKL